MGPGMTKQVALSLWILCAANIGIRVQMVIAQTGVTVDAIEAAQRAAASRARMPAASAVSGSGYLTADPLVAAQVLAAAEKTFPNLAAELETAELFRKAVADPTLRGSLRGRIAEEDWISRNARDGWR